MKRNDAPSKAENNFQEKYLWDDPLLSDEQFKAKAGPVLVAEEIKEYAAKYGLLIADNFDKNGLKSASYYMKPDPNEFWIFNDKGQQISLEKTNVQGNQCYTVPQNSLVYIRLQQQLRLPYYIIGRHNLTIPYVYQGLLLGTGPQVDPGFIGHLFIPLHNLTNRDVRICLNDWFVSIDFVRTSTLNLARGFPKSEKEFLEMYPEKRIIPREKLERKQLIDYLKKAKPISSLGIYVSRLKEAETKASQAQHQLDTKIDEASEKVNREISRAEKEIGEVKEKSEKTINRVESLRRFEAIGLIVLLFIFLTGWFASYYHLESKLESRIQTIVTETQNQLPEIQAHLIDLDKSLQSIMSQENQTDESNNQAERNTLSSKINNITDMHNELVKKVIEIKEKISELDKKYREKN